MSRTVHPAASRGIWARRVVWMLVAALTFPVSSVSAQTPAPPPPPGETEAARLYREAMEAYRDISREWEMDLWYLQGSPERVDPEKAREAIARLQPAMAKLRGAIKAGEPGYALDRSLGFDMPVRHVMAFRSLYGMAMIDINWRAYMGPTQGLADDLIALYSMARHLRQDQVVISSLVESAMFSAISRLAHEQVLARGLLDQAECQRLLSTVNGLIEPDMFGIARAWESERIHTVEWMRRMNQDDATREKLVREFFGNGLFNRENVPTGLADMSPAALTVAIEQYDVAMERWVSILSLRDLDAVEYEAARFHADVEAGTYGPVTTAVMPRYNLGSLMKQNAKMIEDFRADLRLAASSPEGSKVLLNAAVKYREAIGLLRRFDPEHRRVILQGESDPAVIFGDTFLPPPDPAEADAQSGDPEGAVKPPPGPTPEMIDAALEAASPILDLVLEAAAIRRCHFEVLTSREYRPYYSILPEGPQVRSLAAILRLAAARAMERGEWRDATTFIAAGIVMIDHLSQDRMLTSSVAAAEIATALDPLLKRLLDAGDLAENDRALLSESLGRLHADDPLGLRRALADYPKHTTAWVLREAPPQTGNRYQGYGAARMANINSRLDRAWIAADKGEPAAMGAEVTALSDREYMPAFEQLDRLVHEAVSWGLRRLAAHSDDARGAVATNGAAGGGDSLASVIADHGPPGLPTWSRVFTRWIERGVEASGAASTLLQRWAARLGA